MLCVYRGFDGLDVSFAARIDHELCQELEAAKEKAQATRQSTYMTWRGVNLEVGESGAQGGYAFRCATGGELGAIWFFKRPTRGDPWGVRVSCRSFGLATKGLGGMRAELYLIMESLGIVLSGGGESIGRVDYAMDFMIPGFSLEPQNFVMHSNANRADFIEPMSVNGRSGRVTSVTIGKMPGRQVIVYDKRAEVIAKSKPGWVAIWNGHLKELGYPALDLSSAEGSVWRVELRAGKKHLKDCWGIRTWSDLDRQFQKLTQASLCAVRHTNPSCDSNRSRWPNSELWAAAFGQVSDDLFEMNCTVDPDLIKRVQLDAYDDMLAGQAAGLLLTRAALHGLTLPEFRAFSRKTGEEIADRVLANPALSERKLLDRGLRFEVQPRFD